VKNNSAKVPVDRIAEPYDINGVVVFLASNASAYINGETVLMEGSIRA
jgi:NAD(P)-dependent dehydrogenase (short-subunit alcohol dehydrogenase family)